MLQAVKDTIDKKLKPMLRAIKKNKWTKANYFWYEQSCPLCQEFGGDRICGVCPLFRARKGCYEREWFKDTGLAIFGKHDIAILYIGDLIEELKQLKEI